MRVPRPMICLNPSWTECAGQARSVCSLRVTPVVISLSGGDNGYVLGEMKLSLGFLPLSPVMRMTYLLAPPLAFI